MTVSLRMNHAKPNKLTSTDRIQRYNLVAPRAFDRSDDVYSFMSILSNHTKCGLNLHCLLLQVSRRVCRPKTVRVDGAIWIVLHIAPLRNIADYLLKPRLRSILQGGEDITEGQNCISGDTKNKPPVSFRLGSVKLPR